MKLRQEKEELASLKQDPFQVDPDADSLARLQALKGNVPEQAASAQVGDNPGSGESVVSPWKDLTISC